MSTPKPNDPAPDSDAHWLNIVRQHVHSLQYGVVQIVIHDGHVTQIERTERVRLDKPSLTFDI